MDIFLTTYFPNGWEHYLAGGLCIGAATALIFLLSGHVAGMSSVFSSSWSYVSRLGYFQQARWLDSRAWRLWLAVGLVLGAGGWWWAFGPGVPMRTEVPVWQLGLGGFLVGYGARRSGGCTSGHGICGLGSLQFPSLVAVVTFMSTAFITAQLVFALKGA